MIRSHNFRLFFIASLLFSFSSSAGVGLKLGGNYGIGTMKDPSAFSTRMVDSLRVFVFPHYTLNPIFFGVFGDYHWTGQTTPVKNVSNTNMGGSGYLIGPGLGFQFLGVTGMGSYEFVGQYKLKKQTVDLKDVIYSKPRSWRITISIPLSPLVMLDFSYIRTAFSERKYGTAAATTCSFATEEGAAGISFLF